MTDQPIPLFKGEAMLLSWGDTSSRGKTVTFELDIDSAPDTHPFKGLGTGKHGQKFMLVAVPVDDSCQPLSPGAFIPKSEALASADGEGAPPQKQPTPAPGETKGGWYALKPSARAAILCKDGDFLMWANSTWRLQMLLSELPDWLRNRVDVHSRAQLDPDHAQHRPDALKRYLRIEGQYRVDSGQETAPR